MKSIYLFIIAVVLCTLPDLHAQEGKIASGTRIKKGVLKNGLTYYLHSNPASAGAVDFYLLQNVGAILEEDDQNGLAHFLEHMCFRGTKNFPEEAIMNLFKEKGLEYNINAYTGVDQTVYFLPGLPSNDHALLDQCLVVLKDWCNSLILAPDKIDSERSVITEEYRTRSGFDERIWKEARPVIYNFTKYGERDVIGSLDVIKNFKRESLVKFYKDWYRTDLQAVVVIGDIDIYEMETKIERLFSPLPPVENPRERYYVSIPDNKEVLYKHITTNETKTGNIAINYRHDCKPDTEFMFFSYLVNSMLEKRTEKLVKEDSLNLVEFSIQYTPVASDYANYGIDFTYKKNRAKEALSLAAGVHKDILQNGFTEKELELAIKEMQKALKIQKKYYQYAPNQMVFEAIKSNYLYNIDILSGPSMYQIFKNTIESLTPEALKQKMNALYSGPNKSIVVVTRDSTEYLNKEEVENIEKLAEAKQVIPELKEDKKSDVADVDIPVSGELEGSLVVETEKYKEFHAEKWTLLNGATIIYKECNTVRDLINIYGVSKGGNSLLKGDKLANARAFDFFTSCFGVKGLDKTQFEDLLKSSKINCKLSIKEDVEEINMSGKYKEVKKMFQLLYCLFESPEFYKEKYDEAFYKLQKIELSNPNSFRKKLRDTLDIIKHGAERHVAFDKDFFDKLSLDKMKCVYKDRFRNAADFTFYIVGGLSKNLARNLAEKYIGSISSEKSRESFAVLKHQFPKGYNKKVFRYEMPEKKAGMIYTLNAETEYSYQKAVCFNLVKMYIATSMNNVIRGDQDGTYGVRVRNYAHTTTSKNWGFEVSFECDPERVDELNKALNMVIAVIAEKGITQKDLDTAKKMYKKRMPLFVQQDNMSYIGMLKDYIEFGENKNEMDYFQKILDRIDLDYMNKTMKDFFAKADILDVAYLPK